MPKTIEESKESGLPPEPKNSSAQEIKDRKIFEDLLKRLKEHPSAAVFLRLGACYELGKGVLQNLNEAFEYYEKTVASDTMCASAWHNLGRFYEEGLNGIQDDKKAFDCFFKATTFKEKAAAFWISLGKCYLLGKGVTQNNSKAAEYFDKAIQLEPKNPAALSLVQIVDERTKSFAKEAIEAPSNNDISQNHEEAMKDFTLATQRDPNNWKGWYNLGRSYIENVGNKGWQVAGLNCLLKAEHLAPTELDILKQLQKCYENGIGCTVDLSLSKSYTDKIKAIQNPPAEEAKHAVVEIAKPILRSEPTLTDEQMFEQLKSQVEKFPTADLCYQLARCYYLGKGTTKNLELRFKFFKQACDLNPSNAINLLIMAGYYKTGSGVKKNLELAFTYCEKAIMADEKYAPAWVSRGICYQRGEGITQNLDGAFACYSKAVFMDSKHDPAWYNLGICHLEGKGTPQNYMEAIKCFSHKTELAPESYWGWYGLGRCYVENVAERRLASQGITFLEKAHGLDPNELSALKLLKICHERGIGTPMDANKAKTYADKIMQIENPSKEKNKPAASVKVAEKPAAPPLIYGLKPKSAAKKAAPKKYQKEENEMAQLKRELAEAKMVIEQKVQELNVLKRKPGSDLEDSASAKEARKSPTL